MTHFIRSILTASLFSLTVFCSAQNSYNYPFKNYKLPIEQRVNDLVSRLTLDEKVAQMLNATPAIPRLGIPAYDWWSEILHGVARTPYHATVFPQAIAMAATFDTASLAKMADYSAIEGRAIFNKANEDGKGGKIYVGLTFWTPNINIFRDPRWGRGQETYGEDPFLTGTLGKAFVRGLQGNDPVYLKAAACAKHFAVHSGPEPLRHVFDANVSNYDLWDTYLPAFKNLVVNAKVAGVMCAYNAFRKQPCCGNDLLMNDVLRNQWKFTGYVTSDCWAIDDFFKYHKTHPDALSASVDAVLHGTDVECGNEAYRSLIQAVKDGKISEAQLDASLKRLFTIRFRLGMFDPPSAVPYAQTPFSVVESPEHKAHALKMAQQSIVLLKNQNETLPLSKNIKKIAVVGPNADNKNTVLGNYNGMPSEIITALQGIKNKLGNNTEVVYEKGVDFTSDTMFSYIDVNNQFVYDGQQGFKSEYFTNTELKGEPAFIRYEKKIEHWWDDGDTIVNNFKAANFSARYTTNFTANNSGNITFELRGDDGYRFYIDGKEQLNSWEYDGGRIKTYTFNTEKGKTYKLVIEYNQILGAAYIRFRTGKTEFANYKALAERVKDADAIVFVGGISPQLEGEEMDVYQTGFYGGDKTSILLPKVQTNLMKELKATGKPVVFVMMTGSAIASPWESEHIPAIVNTWYDGQAAGTAIADVLFGDYNPAGRLPVTFYKSDSDLPDFNNYSMENRTYRYFKGQPLYPFGYGLSYTTFRYDMLKLPTNVKPGNTISGTVRVTNTGKKDGEEVVQIYVAHTDKTIKAPIRALKGFQRIFLKAGESKLVQFQLSPDDLSFVNEQGKLTQIKEQVVISVGGGQPDTKITTSGNVLKASVKVF